MTVYVYDNTKIDQFTTFSAGDITVGSVENIDYGDINQHVEPERDGDWFFVNDHGLITATSNGVLGLNTATLYSSIMYAERFTNGPYNIQNNGDQIKITLNVALD